ILVEQLTQGAGADVLATADTQTMDKAQRSGVLTSKPDVFATNTLSIVTPPDNPADISSLDDLADASFAVCVVEAPCGEATHRLFDRAGFTGTPVTEEQNVKSVLTKVTTGQVDAGVVYKTDAHAAGDNVTVIEPEGADA